jgi:hypothetical protein
MIIYFLSCTVPLLEFFIFSLKFGDLLLLAMSMFVFLCMPHLARSLQHSNQDSTIPIQMMQRERIQLISRSRTRS